MGGEIKLDRSARSQPSRRSAAYPYWLRIVCWRGSLTVIVAPVEVRSKQDGADAIPGNDSLRRFNLVLDYAH